MLPKAIAWSAKGHARAEPFPGGRHRGGAGVFAKCWFDAQKCARGIDALALYRAEYDGKRAMLKPRPVHDWTSHAADAFRYLAMTLDREVTSKAFSRPLTYPPLGLA